MKKSKIVTVEDLVVAFGDFLAIKGISFEVESGEIFGFVGANGAGKTTTIRVLCGLLSPTKGKVKVAEIDPIKNPIAVKMHIGYMSQRFTLYKDMTIAENLWFAGKLRKLEDEKIESRIKKLISFIELDWPLTTMVKDLPAGVLQQVSLISAIIHDPEIVFLDEPTAGVSPDARSKFWELINKMTMTGKTVFVTTHYLEEAEQCGRIALMHDGKLIALGSPEELKAQAFSETIFEITPPPGAAEGWQDALKMQSFISELQIFGMRYHAMVKETSAFEKYAVANMKKFTYEKIKPSLEDVFIRMVGE